MVLHQRWQWKNIQDALQTRRVLLLEGARQGGKTTLAKQLINESTIYRTLDDATQYQLAQADPQGFVKHDQDMLVIDEVQRVPELLSAIKLMVDDDVRPGQYVLTGSANIQSLPTVQESLAGRVRTLRLRTLTQGEIRGAKPDFLDRAFAGELRWHGKEEGRNALLDMAWIGGFPEARVLEERDRILWCRDYIDAILKRDLNDIIKVQHLDVMRQLVEVLASWSSKLMDLSAIGSGLSIRRPTLESYMNALELLYLADRLQPWVKTDYARVGKQSKLFVADTGLMTAMLGWNKDQVTLDGDRVGKLVETFFYSELAAQVDVSAGAYRLFHYRDREKREIDFIVERDDGALLGIEIKAGSAIGQGDFKHLKWFQNNIAKDRPFTGIVLYTGEVASTMGANMWLVPYPALWR